MPFERPKFEFKIEKPPEIEIEKKEEIDPEEKAKMVREFFIESRTGEKSQEEKKRFREVEWGANELEKFLGKDGFEIVYDTVCAANSLKEELERSGVTEPDVDQFIKEKGFLMIPKRIRVALRIFYHTEEKLSNILANMSLPEKGKRKFVFFQPSFKKDIKLLKEHIFPKLKEEIGEWQKYSAYEREKTERPMKVKGFEKFDFPEARGEELLKKAAEILPRKLSSATVRRIIYRNKIRLVPKKYGSPGMVSAHVEFENKQIVFFKVPTLERKDRLRSFPVVLGHEWGHTIDPRFADQKDLSPPEQLRMITEWEKIRSEEPEFSTFVQEIENPEDKLGEIFLKSVESLAESIEYFLAYPNALKDRCPKRYEFCLFWLKKRFPDCEFDPDKMTDKMTEYRAFINSLEERKTKK